MINNHLSYHGEYVEITKSEHQDGGNWWGFGICLWDPSKDS
jgi:hypothetical protein